jgi:hypothetical protein
MGLLAGAPVFAGSFTTDFSPGSTGYTLAGTGTTPGGFLTNYLGANRAVLAPPVAGNAGSVTVWDSSLDNGQAIESFVANFKIYFGQGSGNAADGVSFNFGPDIADGLISSEEGPGGTALTVSFDIYANTDVGQVSPTVHLKYGGATFASHAYTKADMVDSQLDDVKVELKRNGTLSVTYKGVLVFDNVYVPGWAPTFGLFNFSARSGGEYCEQEIAALSITTVLQGAAVAPTILTNPASVTVNEHGTNTFSVAIDGTAPFTLQWTDNGADIAGETGLTYTMVNIPYTENNHQIKVRVSNPANAAGVTSTAAILTVIRDTTPPTVLKASASSDGNQVTVVFSKPVDVNNTAVDPSNYSINQGVVISYITSLSGTTVALHLTTPLPGGFSYILSIHGVQDTSSTPNTMVPTQVAFNSYLFQVGVAIHKKYNGFGDGQGNLAALQTDPRYPNSPDRQDLMTRFEYPANGVGRDTTADPIPTPRVDYSDTLECFFIPPTTNDYVFYTAAADEDDVYLSTDADPANMVQIARMVNWTNARGWMLPQCGAGDTNGLRSDWYGNNMWPGAGDPTTGSAFIHLDGGQRYYLFAVHHRYSWSGSDDFGVTYTYAGAPAPGGGTAPLLTSSVIGTYLDPTGASVTFTQQPTPTNATLLEARTATFTCLATGQSMYGTTVTYQWQTAPKGSSTFTNIPGATLNSYTTTPLHLADNGRQFKVLATVAGLMQPSSVVTVTVNVDNVPPTVISANPDESGTHVTVVYSEGVTDTALTLSNYSIDQGVTISGITRLDASRVVLATSKMAGTYTLSIHGVQDLAAVPNTIVPTQVVLKTYVLQVGAVLHKKYNGFNDGTADLNSLKNDPRYPNYPDRQDAMTMFEYPAGGIWRDAVADPVPDPRVDYSDTMECYFIPPTTADYVFYAAGSDINDVYLSTDADPANMVNIAQENGWTNPRDWCVSQCGTTNGLRSDWYTGNKWPGAGDPLTGSALIHLNGGQKYYLFAFHHRMSWSGGDVFAVTYSYAGAPVPASGTAPLLTGSVVGTLVDPTGASITFNPQPADATILQGRTATFTAGVTAQSLYGTSVALQWQTAPSGSTTFTNIPGETKSSYTTPVLGVADSGRQYQLVATVPGLTQPSRVATVIVNADTIPPKLVSVAALPSQSGTTFDVGVTFDEPLDPTSAGTLANYTMSVGTPTAVKFYPESQGVVLTVSGLTAGTAYSVTVANVADLYGNHITSANMPGTFSSLHWGNVGADELMLGNGVVAVAPNAFDIYSDGIGEWGAYDEATFVYEQITGDFDKELRVEYQDPSSQYARAGLIVRDVTNFGVDRNGQTTNSLAGRYQKVHVEPVITAAGLPGANDYECNRRLDTGGQTTSGATAGGTPAYPNAWCRLQRVGQKFTCFRSDDGVNWVQIGATTWGIDDTNKVNMPDTVYVGPEYAPEVGSGTIPTSLRAMFGARFRDYRDHGAASHPSLTVTRNPDGTFTLNYTGTLVSSDAANGTYNPVSGAASPWQVNPKATGAKSTQFYRARQ